MEKRGNRQQIADAAFYRRRGSAAKTQFTACMLQNVALFVPVGLLFPLIHPAFDHPGYAVMNGLMLSVWIETIQMITASGTCDVNDILTNTLGTAMGYGTFWIGRGMRK